MEIITTRGSQRYGMERTEPSATQRCEQEKVISAMSAHDDINKVAQVIREAAYLLGVPSSRELEASWRELAKAAIIATLETVRDHQPQAWATHSTAVDLWRVMMDAKKAEMVRAASSL
jgi:hypothetical protein